MYKKRPEFDDIKTYEEFKQYKWYHNELREICRQHGLLYNGTEKKLNEVIEAYFNGVKIPPRRNWYSNIVLNSFVNDNSMFAFTGTILAISLLLTVRGLINMFRGMDDISYVPRLCFGITGLIVVSIGLMIGKDLEVIKSYFPACGDKRFTRAQVDEQANAENTEYLSDISIFLAPNMLIGVNAGIAAVAYEDIAALQVKKIWHSERVGGRYSRRYRDYYTYKLFVITKKHKRVAMSDGKQDPKYTVQKIYEHCLQYNPQIKLLPRKLSMLATDESEKQVREGKGLRESVEKAVQEQYLTRITVGEDLKKGFTGFHLRFAIVFIPESILVCAIIIVVFQVIFHIPRIFLFVGGVTLIAGVLLPGYAVYNLFSTIRSIRKNDIEFYSCELIDKNEKGYVIKGLIGVEFGYIKKLKPVYDPEPGDMVILARFKDEFSLISG